MSGGRVSAPVTFHCLEGVRGGGAPQHSHSVHGMLWNAPGIEIVLPSCAGDAYGLIRQALVSDNPTYVMSHAKLLAGSEERPDVLAPIPFGRARVRRVGDDVTVVALSVTVPAALAAAEMLAEEGISAEVIDPRTLVPFDSATILASIARTGRLVVVDEAPLQGGPASVIAGMMADLGFGYLRAPIARVARPDTPVAFAAGLEAVGQPTAERVVAAVRRVMGGTCLPVSIARP